MSLVVLGLVAAGLTTMAGLGSFVMMDIAPMRTFGTFTALGITVILFSGKPRPNKSLRKPSQIVV